VKVYLRQTGPAFKRPDGTEVKPKALMHYCHAEGCERWGEFGFGVRLLEGRSGNWFCSEHVNRPLTPDVQDAPVEKTEAPEDEQQIVSTGDSDPGLFGGQ
jgi:hypothetical protein